MRKIGVLDDILPDPTGRGLIRYRAPQRDVITPKTIGIRGIWRNFFDYMAQAEGLPTYDNWGHQPSRKKFVTRAKQRVASYMKQVGSMELEVREFEWKGRQRKALFSTRTGKQFGTIDKVNDAEYEVGQRITISGSIASDGNLRAVVEQ